MITCDECQGYGVVEDPFDSSAMRCPKCSGLGHLGPKEFSDD